MDAPPKSDGGGTAVRGPGWDLPSAAAREVIRQGARLALAMPAEWLDELDGATLSSGARAIADDPVLAAGTRRTNRANVLVWAAANVHDPGARVPPNIGEEPLAVARDLVRRGLNESALDAYRIGQGVALRLWTQIVCSLTTDVDLLREVLDVSCRSISDFVDATVAAISARMQSERRRLTHGSYAERLETALLLIDGAPIARARAEAVLGHPLTGAQTAAVVWSEDPGSDLSHLDRAAEAIGVSRPLVVVAASATRWVWTQDPVDLAALRERLGALPGVMVAVGARGAGSDGFRRSHLEALTTQRLLARRPAGRHPAGHPGGHPADHPAGATVAGYEEVELVSLVTQDPARAEEFVARTLGDLRRAPAEVIETLAVYLSRQCNAARTADQLFTHRNTVLRRLARAEELLPRPLAEHQLQVAVALDVLRWRGGD